MTRPRPWARAFTLALLQFAVTAAIVSAVWYALGRAGVPWWENLALTMGFALALEWSVGVVRSARRPITPDKIKWRNAQRVRDAADALPPMKFLMNELEGEMLVYSWTPRRVLGIIPRQPFLEIFRLSSRHDPPAGVAPREGQVINIPCVVYRFVGRRMLAVEAYVPAAPGEAELPGECRGMLHVAPLPPDATGAQIAERLRSGMRGKSPDDAAVEVAVVLGGCVVHPSDRPA